MPAQTLDALWMGVALSPVCSRRSSTFFAFPLVLAAGCTWIPLQDLRTPNGEGPSCGVVEIPYDGIDNDCRDGDLVDVDFDGYPGVAEADYPGAFPEAFAGRGVDCADDPERIPEAASIAPDPTILDVPYDGLDANCDRSNDFDYDGDGFMPTKVRDPDDPAAWVDVATQFEAYRLLWGISDGEAEAWVAASGLTLQDPRSSFKIVTTLTCR